MEIPPKSLAMPRYSIFAIDGAPGSSGKWIHGATRGKVPLIGAVNSDSDGKFSLTLTNAPSHQGILYAKTERTIAVDNTEHYLWIIPLTGQKNQKLTLSNENNLYRKLY